MFSALAVVIVLLLITYRNPVLWLLPVTSAGVALTSAEAVIYLLAEHAGLTVNAQSAGILDASCPLRESSSSDDDHRERLYPAGQAHR